MLPSTSLHGCVYVKQKNKQTCTAVRWMHSQCPHGWSPPKTVVIILCYTYTLVYTLVKTKLSKNVVLPQFILIDQFCLNIDILHVSSQQTCLDTYLDKVESIKEIYIITTKHRKKLKQCIKKWSTIIFLHFDLQQKLPPILIKIGKNYNKNGKVLQ
jgi:hypothetical protein